jgi:pSer/pThr/pTyr-binding forkhead associated (FHA) protein
MIAKLIPIDGAQAITIGKEVSLVGRKNGLCDIIVDHASISKLHCAIARTDGLLFVRDLGSTNGTKVNGQRITRAALLPGDELAFASVRYRVYLGPGEAYSHEDRTEMLQLPTHDSAVTFGHDDEEEDDSIVKTRDSDEESPGRRSGFADSREFAI